MSIRENILQIRASIPEYVTLVAVSKFHPTEAIREAYDAGQRIFGESRAQELKDKHQALPDDIEWHFIGQMQRNKVKDIASFVHTIQSIDSLKLIEEVEKQAARHNRVIRILLEIHIAREETKTGFTPGECCALLSSGVQAKFPHVLFSGLMGMATFTDNEALIREELKALHCLFVEFKDSFFENKPEFCVLSMGMSADYPVAISEGSNMIRV